MECTFTGTARRVEVHGAGSMSLLRRDVFEQGAVASVDLPTANVGRFSAPVTIDDPKGLDAVRVNPSEERPPFRAIYEIVTAPRGATELRIDIDSGVERRGQFKGEIQGRGTCQPLAPCEVVWPDAKRITMVLHLAANPPTAQTGSAAPIRLTGKFPFVDSSSPGSKRQDRLDGVVLSHVTGELTCEADTRRIDTDGQLVWTAPPDGSVRVDETDGKGGVLLTPDGLRVTLVSSFTPVVSAQASESAPGPPSDAKPVHSMPTSILIVAVALVAIAMVAWWSRRRPKRAEAQAPSDSAAEPSRLGLSVSLVLLAVPEDEPFSRELRKQLKPHNHPVFDPNDPEAVPGGADAEGVLRHAIATAQVVAVLVSADLLNAPEPWPGLVDLVLHRRAKDGLGVVPVLCRPCALKDRRLRSLKALPRDGAPLSSAANEAILEAKLCEVAEDLSALLEGKGPSATDPADEESSAPPQAPEGTGGIAEKPAG